MADPQDSPRNGISNSKSGKTESSSGKSLRSAPTLSDKGDTPSDRQVLIQAIELDGMKTQLMLSQSDNRLLRQRLQEYAELTH